MKIKLLCKIPEVVCVGVSGGPDSMALLHFLHQKPWRTVHVLHVKHTNSEFAKSSQKLVRDYCSPKENMHFHLKELDDSIPCKEYDWAHQRHNWFENPPVEAPVLLGHHLDDVIEKWIWSSFCGEGRLTNVWHSGSNVYRPLLTTPKKVLVDWCLKHEIPHIDDPTNLDGTSNKRSIIRANMDFVLKINPGIHRVLARKIMENEEERNKEF